MVEAVYGLASVAAALTAGRRSLVRLVLADTAFKPGKSPPPIMRRIRAQAESQGIPIGACVSFSYAPWFPVKPYIRHYCCLPLSFVVVLAVKTKHASTGYCEVVADMVYHHVVTLLCFNLQLCCILQNYVLRMMTRWRIGDASFKTTYDDSYDDAVTLFCAARYHDKEKNVRFDRREAAPRRGVGMLTVANCPSTSFSCWNFSSSKRCWHQQ